jgi:hypothetical protein
MLKLLKGVFMEKDLDVWLTTDDNPWNPFTQFESWFEFDAKRYMTCGKIAKRAHISEDNMSDYENDQEIVRAIEDIVDNDFVIDPSTGEVRHYRLCTPNDCVDW